MKERRFKRSIVFTFCLMLMIGCAILVSSTYARYTSSYSGSDSAHVAKWSWEITGADNQGNYTFDLFKTVKDTSFGEEQDVTAGLIAPGTSGHFQISLKNTSEVNATYSINYTVADAGVPLEFCVGTTEACSQATATWDDSLTNVSNIAIAMQATQTVDICWRWKIDSNDVTDTTLGIAGTATPSVTAAITVTQVD